MKHHPNDVLGNSAHISGLSADLSGMAQTRAVATKDPFERFGWIFSAVWLVYLYYPLKSLLQSPASSVWIWIGWIATIAFVACYIVGIAQNGGLNRPVKRSQWACFGVLIVCVPLLVPGVGSNTLSYFPFLMAYAAFSLNRVAHWVTFAGAMAIFTVVLLVMSDGGSYIQFWLYSALFGMVFSLTRWFIIKRSETEGLKLEAARGQSREALARDVHDLVGHSLTVVRLKAQLAEKLIDSDPQRAKAEIIEIESLTAEAIAGVRATVAGAQVGSFAEQLEASREALHSAGIIMRIDGQTSVLSPAQKITATWIVREATTNILRHSNAHSVIIKLLPGVLSITDDGCGMHGEEGNGVRGMRERANVAHARFQMVSPREGGTCVEVVW